MSLLEIIISVSILLVLCSLVLQALVSAKLQTAMGEADDDINRDSSSVLQTISLDLAESGWHFPDGNRLSTTFVTDRNERYFPYVVQQRSLSSLGQGLGSRFPHVTRDEAMVRLPALSAVLPGDAVDADTNYPDTALVAYRASYSARSQELIFLRQNTRGWPADPTLRQPPLETFPEGDWNDNSVANRQALGILAPSAWIPRFDSGGLVVGWAPRPWDVNRDGSILPNPVDGDGDGLPDGSYEGDLNQDGVPDLPASAVPYGAPLLAGELVLGGSSLTLRPIWETLTAPNYQVETGTEIPEELREFMYAVVPSPFGGTGRLLRAYKCTLAAETNPLVSGTFPGQFITPISAPVPTYGMKVDRVLSEHVARILFDTFRTDSTLDVNQVRVRIYFARPSVADPKLVLFRTIDTVIGMRAKVSEANREDDQFMLTGSCGFDY